MITRISKHYTFIKVLLKVEKYITKKYKRNLWTHFYILIITGHTSKTAKLKEPTNTSPRHIAFPDDLSLQSTLEHTNRWYVPQTRQQWIPQVTNWNKSRSSPYLHDCLKYFEFLSLINTNIHRFQCHSVWTTAVYCGFSKWWYMTKIADPEKETFLR